MRRVTASTARPASPRRALEAGGDYGRSVEPNWRGTDWAARLKRARVDGAEINYVDLRPPGHDGQSQAPVVFVHGLGGQWQNWLENLLPVGLDRRVVALDLPGFGCSSMLSDRITINAYGRCVEALCERLDLGPVALVGNSMGGFIGAEVAIQFPARVERLVLVSAAGISTAGLFRAPVLTLGRAATALTLYSGARHRALAGRPIARHLALALVARHPSRLAPDMAWEGLIKGAGKSGFDNALRACLEYDFRERLPEIACPTLVAWGEDDAILPVRDASEFERLIPDCRKLLMRDTGHMPQVERPAAFNDCLLGFLGEAGPAEALEPVQGQSQVA